ncbi:MAG: GIY-YIG nuclease family protein [Salinivirgaceae bacterium]
MFYVYAIKSELAEWIYVGLTHNIEQRLAQHNKGYNKSTKPYRPFKIIYTEEQPDRISARKREKYLKSAAGKRFLRNQ